MRKRVEQTGLSKLTQASMAEAISKESGSESSQPKAKSWPIGLWSAESVADVKGSRLGAGADQQRDEDGLLAANCVGGAQRRSVFFLFL